MRAQLSDLLDQARAELASGAAEEVQLKVRAGKPKTLQGTRASRRQRPARGGQAQAESRVTVARRTRRGGRVSLAGRKRASSPTGPLAPAVIKVLQSKKQPMRVHDILEGLTANGYKFNSSEPKKNLAARIYRLSGVKQVGAGLFGLA